jgi:hypothetical protein
MLLLEQNFQELSFLMQIIALHDVIKHPMLSNAMVLCRK